MNTQLSTEQLIDEVRKSLEIAIQKDKPSIVAILRKNGIQVDSSMGDDLIFIAVLKSIKDSPVIRKDITKYLQQTAAAGYSSYVGADATSTDPTTTTTDNSQSFWQQVVSPQRVGQVLDVGVSLLANSILLNQKKQGEQTALTNQLNKTNLGAKNTTTAAKSSLMIPIILMIVAIGIGVGIYMYAKRKK